MEKIGFAGTALCLLVACSPDIEIDYSGPTDDWPAYGGSPGGGHYSAATQITPDNVTALEQAWIFQSPDHRGAGETMVDTLEGEIPSPPSGFQVTPILFEDTLYMCTSFSQVIALDPSTGVQRWSWDPQVARENELLTNCRGVSSWQSPKPDGSACDSRIIVGTLDGRLVSLDAKTGEPCKGFGDQGTVDLSEGLGDHHPYEYSVTSPPAILGNKIILGAFVIDSARVGVPGGVVRAYDVLTGELAWFWDPLPPGQAAAENLPGTQHYARGTTNVWSIISVDAEHNLVFLPTGNTSTDYYGGHRAKDFDYYSSSVVALNGDTGKVVWNFQMVHHDVWDYDTPSQPTLFDFERDGKTIPALAQPTKMGHLFFLNRLTGEPLLPVEERPVPQDGLVAGEYLSPTQPFPIKPVPLHPYGLKGRELFQLTPFDTSCADKLATIRDEGIFTPISTEGTLIYPSPIGGNNWGTPALDQERNAIVLNTTRMPMVFTLLPRDECDKYEGDYQRYRPQQGTDYCVVAEPLLSSVGFPCNGLPLGTLVSVDLTTGDVNWEVPLGSLQDMVPVIGRFFKGAPTIGGPMVTQSGLTFIASTPDHHLRAFDTETGAELWKGRLPEAGIATPMSYRVDKTGKQYVVIAAGGHWGLPSADGAYLVAFALPD
ncbi:MAG: pyrroloquinoline quinone-dependent dehydrogenase [Gammaproteobacteria bacterium]|nr:pyrroloquinoline quinone-dependent dehydrogenase [Gammaproteobacteria bacterium]